MLLTLSESSACQVPICAVAADGLTIHTDKWFLGSGFLGAPPISLSAGHPRPHFGHLLRSVEFEHAMTYDDAGV